MAEQAPTTTTGAQTVKGSDGLEYVFTPASSDQLASEGGMLHRLGHAAYEALPEITGGAAALTPPPFDVIAPPLVGGVTAGVQRLLEGEGPGAAIKSAGVHAGLNTIPAVGKIPAVGRAIEGATSLSTIANKIPGGSTLLSAIKSILPEGMTEGPEAIDVAGQMARYANPADAPLPIQIAAQQAKLEKLATNPQARAAVLRTIDALKARAASAAAAQAGGRLTGAMRTTMPLAEMIKAALYPNER